MRTPPVPTSRWTNPPSVFFIKTLLSKHQKKNQRNTKKKGQFLSLGPVDVLKRLTTQLWPNVITLSPLVPTSIDQYILHTILGATKTTQCRMPALGNLQLSVLNLAIFLVLSRDERPDVVAEGCTHFPQLLAWERTEKLNLKLKLGKLFNRIPLKYGHICVGFILTPFPTCPPSATVTSTKNDLQY